MSLTALIYNNQDKDSDEDIDEIWYRQERSRRVGEGSGKGEQIGI